MAGSTLKRKLDAIDDGSGAKRVNKAKELPVAGPATGPGAGSSLNGGAATALDPVPEAQTSESKSSKGKGKEKTPSNDVPAGATNAKGQKHKVRKLDAPRPFPTVPSSVSATGPRSAHHEGKNYIAITRKTTLGTYLRRCKDAVLKDGYKTLHLNALGAAIPHLTLLAVSLPSILPFAADEIHTELRTGTVEVMDELIPDDEDEDISYRTRGKSSLSVVITIGDGVDEKDAGGSKWAPRGKRRARGAVGQDEGEKKRKADAGSSGPQDGEESAMDLS